MANHAAKLRKTASSGSPLQPKLQPGG